jgi:hypothetical protein
VWCQKYFGNIQCLSHSSSHGFLFFANPVKKSLRSLSLSLLSLPNTTPRRVSRLAAVASRSKLLPSIVRLWTFPQFGALLLSPLALRGSSWFGFFFLIIIWGQLPWSYRGRCSHPAAAHHVEDGADYATHIFCPALCDHVRISSSFFSGDEMASC